LAFHSSAARGWPVSPSGQRTRTACRRTPIPHPEVPIPTVLRDDPRIPPLLSLFPSVQILFVCFCEPDTGHHGRTYVPGGVFLKKPSLKIKSKSSSLSLFPSVQILFVCFCEPDTGHHGPDVRPRRGFSQKAIPKNPIQILFVIFVSFCSNPLCLLL
jgi:hypothetical protein